MNKKLLVSSLIALSIFSAVSIPQAAEKNAEVSLNADIIEYNAETGFMTAEGNVKMLKDGATLTGKKAFFNVNTKETNLSGDVRAVKDDALMTANEITSSDGNCFSATGNVYFKRAQDIMTANRVDYYTDRAYILAPNGGQIVSEGTTITGDKIESFLNENKTIATGNVHIVSTEKNLDATSNEAVHYGSKGENKVVLIGNAKAVQNQNTLTGKTLTIYLGDQGLKSGEKTKTAAISDNDK